MQESIDKKNRLKHPIVEVVLIGEFRWTAS